MRASGIGEPVWHGVAAGWFAGAAGVLIGHAFDTAKVQAQVGKSSGGSLLTLYRGILPPLLTTGATRSLYFGVYEWVKPHAAAALCRPTQDLTTVFVAGAGTGFLTAPATAPIQRLKLVQQIEGGSLRSTFSRLMASGTLARGLGLHMTLETIGSGCYLVSYAAAKEALRCHGSGVLWNAREASQTSEEPLMLRILSGMAAGCAGWLSIYPLDVLRSRVMSAPPEARSREGIVQMTAAAIRNTYASGGLHGFYRGLSFTLMRAAPVAGTVLPVYDAGKTWLAGK